MVFGQNALFWIWLIAYPIGVRMFLRGADAVWRCEFPQGAMRLNKEREFWAEGARRPKPWGFCSPGAHRHPAFMPDIAGGTKDPAENLKTSLLSSGLET